MKYVILFILMLFCSNLVWAQKTKRTKSDSLPPHKGKHGAKLNDDNEVDEDNEMQMLIENLLQDSDSEDFSFDTQFEYLEEYAKNPMDINAASQKDLTDFGLLSELQVQGLLNYRREVGQIFSVYELPNVPAFDRLTVLKILPYITLSATKEKEKFNFGRAFKYGRHTLFGRYQQILEKQKGYTPLDAGSTAQRYLGTPDRLYFRYRMTYKDRMSFGVTMEKDAGEEFFKGSNKKGFDFYSGHFFVKDLNKTITAVALGDFQVFWGQGLAVWSGFGIRKSPAVLNIKRIAPPIKPFTSVNEALFFRGGAIAMNFGKKNNIELVSFISYRGRDANASVIDSLDGTLDDTNLGEVDISEVSSLQNSGFHRTTNEVADRNSIKMLTTGVSLKYKGANWHIASNTVYNNLSATLFRGTDPYQNYLFHGRNLVNTSLDYSYNYKHFQFFGETALSSNGGVATLNGVLANLDSRVNLGMLHRYFSPQYQNLQAGAFGERTGVNNESGLYLGLDVQLGKGFKLASYIDAFKMPWLTSTTDAPNQGYEWFAKMDYNVSRRWNLYVQYKYEGKGKNQSGQEDGYFHNVIPTAKHTARLHGYYQVSEQLEFKSRLELSWYKDTQLNTGVLLYQDIIYKPSFVPIKIQARLALFDAVNYNNRLYAYENDVLYSFSVPAYYGRGMRYYINFHYDITNSLTIWLRFAQTIYTDRTVVSSGLNQIDGNTRSEVKVQIRYEF